MTNYQLYLHPLIDARLQELKTTVKRLKASNPTTYQTHSATKLLAKVIHAMRVEVPTNPSGKRYQLGNTIQPYKHWCRVKRGLPQRYRLFFRYTNKPPIIIYVWLNDELSLRKEGAKTDVYALFKKMLAKGEVPNSVSELLANANPYAATD